MADYIMADDQIEMVLEDEMIAIQRKDFEILVRESERFRIMRERRLADVNERYTSVRDDDYILGTDIVKAIRDKDKHDE